MARAGPQFIDKVRDIVGLYLDPPAKALVLCVDEKGQIQALDRTAPCLPILPATPAGRAHDYVRNGTTSRPPADHRSASTACSSRPGTQGDLAGAVSSGEAQYNEKVRQIEQIIRHFTEVAADLNEPLLPFRARTAARVANGNLRSNQLPVPVRYPCAAGRATRLRMIEF